MVEKVPRRPTESEARVAAPRKVQLRKPHVVVTATLVSHTSPTTYRAYMRSFW